MKDITFGKWLKATREAAGLTQQQLAERADCTRAYVSSLEREVIEGNTGRPIQPSKEKVDSFARALGIPVSEARQKAGYTSDRGAAPEESELLNYFRELPKARREELMRIIKALYDTWTSGGIAVIESPDVGPALGPKPPYLVKKE